MSYQLLLSDDNGKQIALLKIKLLKITASTKMPSTSLDLCKEQIRINILEKSLEIFDNLKKNVFFLTLL